MLIYGANGYTGELITRYAVERGMRPIIAGRNETAIRALAEKHGLGHRVFSLDETAKLDAALNEVAMVLHCAGPFSMTSRQMGEACLRTKTHYTDITGEIAVFEACAAADGKAKDAGIMIMPGVGFDVVPSDCLARHLKDRLPTATDLTLAFYGIGRMSHGTQATMTMNIGNGGAVRREGKIMPVPAAWRTREIDFGEGVVKTGVTIPWGDVSTAFYSTGIPNIEVYTVAPRSAVKMMKLSRYLGPLLSTRPIQRYLQSKIPPGGPTDEERAKGKTLLWGEVSDEAGGRVEARMECPEGYTTTALAALNIAEKILAGNFLPGFQTPARAYGADLILELDGTVRENITANG
ncbi:saccharopine dehydrogenase family protein [Leptolyngbya sp. 7M]|uniref:saccharopine dehydrogenase family protein n=1 Tax=Leptolyngbya sp. 7M TaxID=2812896 RepID=UPI001B8D7CB7|nr:saccharopine dehydrogenase NADP-binding domain-containing protein [Leptolyngbya sp. 7M]QYO68369.1 saccharopine dehydrogenase NADP-binding domain-containing protein [Leptolyngbya sp. 7M]